MEAGEAAAFEEVAHNIEAELDILAGAARTPAVAGIAEAAEAEVAAGFAQEQKQKPVEPLVVGDQPHAKKAD